VWATQVTSALLSEKMTPAFYRTTALQDFNWVARTPAGHDSYVLEKVS
jgi:hypothetical protein